ncbi:MAG: GNAT family N-acetyltransferase [Candidatus Aenigmarchaeota archaeon]|nr:GNAT family N-acetyltransferase [Candidatus Aenigmarchaeota archaeon]
MKEGKTVDRIKIRKGNKEIEIVIRYPKKSDLTKIWKFYNKVIKETPFLARITPVSRKEEEKWFRETMEGMRKKNEIYIVAEHKGKIVGSASVTREELQTHKHAGVYGICVLQEYTGKGLGKRLSWHVLRIAKDSLNIEIVKLSVYKNNRVAQKLYKRLGFAYAGKIPGGIKRKGKYTDDIIMYKVLK